MVRGEGPHPSLVVRLVQGLPDTSLTSALASGGRDHYGWGHDRYLMASIFDAINANTRATGNFKGKPPTMKPWPRPTSKPRAKHKKEGKGTLRSIFARFSR